MCGSAPCAPCKLRKLLKKHEAGAIARFISAGQDDPTNTIAEFSPGLMADFIAPEDRVLAYLAIAVYGQRPQQIRTDTQLLDYQPNMSSIRVGVWLGCSTAYVAFRGTSVGKSQGFMDLLDDLILASEDTCQLSISDQGIGVIQSVYDLGYRDIQVSGHSLGGRAAMCNSTQPGVTKVVVLNAAAPVTAPTNIGPGPAVATHYHIAGDLISTHMASSAANIVRIAPAGSKLVNQKDGFVPWIPDNLPQVYDFDWLSGYYHSTDRFLASGGGGNVISVQAEEDSLEWFMLFGSRQRLLSLSLIASVFGDAFFLDFKDLLCQNPIDGSRQSAWCVKEMDEGFKLSQRVTAWLTGIVGAIIGFFAGGPLGAFAGFNAAKGFYEGNLIPIIESVIPGFELLTDLLKFQIAKFGSTVIKLARKQQIDINKYDAAQLLNILAKPIPQSIVSSTVGELS
jgi:hypothetical protein